ncbi:RICIN domain-containing protein [Eleftheria terrae]|uniref:RICIN domain-containing protein n=1 Tax=Eleftheria terrae TaxID=1597781 RepID=UPI00263B3D1E|nr:RICIN domain-containing protein [Eleftheria terrae]WKB53322.1 RICIN domain-containing protein [Eleftheria terrae]
MNIPFNPAGRQRAGLTLALVAGAALTACGGGDSGNNGERAAAADTAARAAAQAAGTLAPGRYVLANARSGKCMDVAGAGSADGVNIQQANCNGSAAQSFDLAEVAPGEYKLLNAGSGKAVDVANGSTADGANIQQWSDNGSAAQRFRIEPRDAGQQVLVNVGSGLCVDVAAGSLDDGANIQQAHCNGSGAQLFRLSPAATAAPGAPVPGRYRVKSVHSGLCLAIEGASTADGGRAIQAGCDDGAAQRFEVRDNGDGSWRFVNLNSGRSLDIAGVSTANGALLHQWQATDGANQRFVLSPSGSGAWAIQARHSNKCLDVKDWSTASGGLIQQWDCAGTANQQWALEPATGTPPPTPGWQLVWRDEFDGNALDGAKWGFEVNGGGGGNNELQYYTDRPQNAYVGNGVLTLQALKERYCSTDGCRDYTSARLRTLGKGDWLFGRMEVRARLPRGQGLWPAIWMLPTDWVYGGWAASGEIDIMEAVNTDAAGGNTIYGSIHYGAPWPGNQHKTVGYTPPGSVSGGFHTYAVEWEPRQIRWYVDGVHYATQTEWWSSGGAYPAPFDRRFHLILNVAVGGNWPGAPNGATTFPQKMEVDFVRVYQKAGS